MYQFNGQQLCRFWGCIDLVAHRHLSSSVPTGNYLQLLEKIFDTCFSGRARNRLEFPSDSQQGHVAAKEHSQHLPVSGWTCTTLPTAMALQYRSLGKDRTDPAPLAPEQPQAVFSYWENSNLSCGCISGVQQYCIYGQEGQPGIQMPIVHVTITTIYKRSVMDSLQHDIMIWNTDKNHDREVQNCTVFSPPSIKTIPFNCNKLYS